MKKLTCTLLVAMFTMTSILFAQLVGGGVDGWVSDYFIVTNKTTKETKTVPFHKFTSEGNNKSYDVDFCLGVYKGDEIEITYKPETSIDPQTAWSYSWNGDLSTSLGTAFTAKLSINSVPYNGSTLTFACNHQNLGNSRTYNIRFKNVHNKKRITLAQWSDTEIQVAYAYYSDDGVYSCSGQFPKTELYDLLSGQQISTGSLNAIGIGTLATKGKTGTLGVKVFVNNVDIFTGKILVR